MDIKCYHCKIKKDISEFYVCPSLHRGYSAYCKTCVRTQQKNRYEKSPKLKEELFLYSKTDKGREIRKKATRHMMEKYPEKWSARILVRSAIRKGIIKKQPCFMCGEIEVQAHHEDYSKPLEVIFLCSNCHSKRHQMLKNYKLLKPHD